MPTYQFRFRCNACGEAIVRTARIDAYDARSTIGVQCPRCHGDDLDREAATFSLKAGRPPPLPPEREHEPPRRAAPCGRDGFDV
jgi:hypothetical protein